jgi:hypothetical protein
MSVDRRGNDAQGAGACSPETIGSLSVAASKGNIAAGMREVSARNLFTKLRMDICERRSEEGSGAIDVLPRNTWLLVPVQRTIKDYVIPRMIAPSRRSARSNEKLCQTDFAAMPTACRRGLRRLTGRWKGLSPFPEISS